MAKQIWKPGNMIYPLPAVMVSCQREGEKPNIITVAWTGTVCTNPPMVYISVRPQRYSYDILDETGEFVINLTTKELARATDYCGVRSGRDVDKFKETGLTAVEATKVKAPLIAEAPVNIECRITEKKELGSHHMFLAEVLAVHVDEKYLDENGKFQLNKSGLIAYSHGEYLDLGKEIGTFGYSCEEKDEKATEEKKEESGEVVFYSISLARVTAFFHIFANRIKCCIQVFSVFRGWFFRKIGIGICFVAEISEKSRSNKESWTGSFSSTSLVVRIPNRRTGC